MDTRQISLVDAFTSEPTGGMPMLVVLDDDTTSSDQYEALSDEFATDTATLLIDESSPQRLQLSSRPGFTEAVDGGHFPDESPALVAALELARERGLVTAGTTTLATPSGDRTVEIDQNGRTWTGFAEPHPEHVDVAYDAVADALGVDSAALRDVGADLPATRLDAGVDALAVPVNFLEHLSGATPDADALAAVTAETDVDALCAFTFDTLEAEAACHARTFVPDPQSWPRAQGTEIPVTPRIVAGTLTHVVRRGTVEGAMPTVEQGHFAGRPSQVHVRTEALQVGGRAVTTLDGTVTLPAADDDDIIEA